MLERFLLVLLLAAPVLASNDPAGWDVHDLNCGIGRVHALAARAAGPANFDSEVFRLDFEIDFLGLGQNGDGRGGGVDAPLRFGRRHALHAMHAALVTQLFGKPIRRIF